MYIELFVLSRTSNLTVRPLRFYRKIIESLTSNSNRKLSDVGKGRNDHNPVGVLKLPCFPTPDNFPSRFNVKGPITSDGCSSNPVR